MAVKPVEHRVPGIAGVRKSPRVYTHAVVGNRDLAADRAWELAGAPKDVEMNWAFYEQQAGPNPPYPDIHGSVEEAKRKVALGKAGYQAELEAAVNARHDKYEAQGNELGVLQWSMSERAARNAVGSFVKRGWKNVQVREVVRG